MTVLGVYWAPGHQRPGDIEYMQRLQPPAVRVLDPDPNQLVIAHNAAPNALILPRDWALSEQHDDVRRDPVGTGVRHAQEWRQKLDRWALPIPANQLVVVGLNEPRVWDMLPQAVQYTNAMLDECTRLGLRACALNLSVGWPANTGPDTPPDWAPYASIEAAIKRGNHFLTLHEYWYKTGPNDGATWHAWRHRSCPWNVPIIIGECGVDNYVDKARWDVEKGNRGWRGHMDGQHYAAQLGQYARGCDKRVVAILPFLTDYRSNNWESFDTLEAHGSLLASRETFLPQGEPPQHATRLPSVGTGPTPAVPPAQVPSLVHPIANPALRRITQHFGPAHTGIDFAAPLGTPIRAVDTGTVIETGDDPRGYGLYVKLRHSWGESLYAHLSQRHVGPDNPNVPVDAGTTIGLSGSTGNSTGPHLHFAIRVNPYRRVPPHDGFSDPLPYLGGTGAPTQPPQKPVNAGTLTLIKDAAKEFSLDWRFVASLAWYESSWQPTATSPAGAMGIMQLMPPTWEEWRVKVGASNPYDDRDNIRTGTAYLAWLLQQLNGNEWSAVTAYNFGIGNVLQGVKPPPETLEHARRVIKTLELLEAISV